jgi:uncharacterized membrane protein YphA (DoxX/SURF4 family)
MAGRILVAAFLLYNAYDHFAHVSALARHAAARGVPAPEAAIVISGVLLLVAGLSFLLGILPRLGVAALVLFLVPVTLFMHAFWADRNPATRMMDMMNFAKNAALLGSALMFLGIPEPWPLSLHARPRLRLRPA